MACYRCGRKRISAAEAPGLVCPECEIEIDNETARLRMDEKQECGGCKRKFKPKYLTPWHGDKMCRGCLNSTLATLNSLMESIPEIDCEE